MVLYLGLLITDIFSIVISCTECSLISPEPGFGCLRSVSSLSLVEGKLRSNFVLNDLLSFSGFFNLLSSF